MVNVQMLFSSHRLSSAVSMGSAAGSIGSAVGSDVGSGSGSGSIGSEVGSGSGGGSAESDGGSLEGWAGSEGLVMGSLTATPSLGRSSSMIRHPVLSANKKYIICELHRIELK